MLDVHAPHGKLAGIRDFLLHLFTITVGLLIALGLEGCAERHHKAELRREAEMNLQQEIRDNAKELAEWKPIMKQEEKSLVRILDFIAAKKAGKDYDVSGIQMGFSIRSLNDASWRTATATGALSLMDYGQVQGYAAAYQVQEEMIRLEQLTLDGFLQMQSYVVYGFDPEHLSTADAAAAEPEVRQTLAHLMAMDEIADGVAQEFAKVLHEGK